MCCSSLIISLALLMLFLTVTAASEQLTEMANMLMLGLQARLSTI